MTRALLLLLIAAVLALGAYRIYQSRTASNGANTAQAGLYRCAMHPNYTSQRPGTCPICGMRLTQKPGPAPESKEVMISREEQQRAGIALERVTRLRLPEDVVAPGTVVLDSPTLINSPLTGVIQNIFIATHGPNALPVRRGELVFEIAPKQPSGALGASKQIRAPATGWITISAQPGAAVPEGSAVAFYSSVEVLPVIADVPVDRIDLVQKGASAEMTSDSDPGRTWAGAVTNVFGIYSEKSRAVKVKLEFPNQSLNMRSNLPVHIRIHHAGPPVLAVPEDAVLWSGNRWICYVPQADSRFLARPVKLGAHAAGFYEVRSGLKLADPVAAKAAFLIDSEARLRPQIEY